MTALLSLVGLFACTHRAGTGADAPLVVAGTVVDSAGAEAAFTAHLGTGRAVAWRFDYGAVQTMVAVGPDGARQLNYSGQVEPLTDVERTEVEALAAALRARPPTGEPWIHSLGDERMECTLDVIRKRTDADGVLALTPRDMARMDGPHTTVPLTILPTGHAAISATVADTELTWLVDTGAGISVIDLAEATRLGIEGVVPVSATGIGGKEVLTISAPTSVSVGDATVDLAMAQYDLAPIAGALGTPIHGVLGKELFRAFVVGFDRSSAQLVLYDRDEFQRPDGYEVVPLTSGADGRSRAPAHVEGRPALVDLDTGSNDTLLIYPSWGGAAGLPGDRAVGSTLIGGVGGTRPVTRLMLSSVSFAGHVWTDVPATLDRDSVVADGDAAVAGNLGSGILGRYDTVLDSVDATLWAKVRNDAHGPFDRSRAGLQFLPVEGGWQLVYVAPEWDQADEWVAGEVVTHIDGEPVQSSGDLAWATRPAGTTVRFRLQDGAERLVVLTDWW